MERERVSSRAPPPTRPTHARTHARTERCTTRTQTRRIQDERKRETRTCVCGTRARDVPPKNGVNNIEIYLFTGINHRELYDGAYITQIGALYQSARSPHPFFLLRAFSPPPALAISSRDILYPFFSPLPPFPRRPAAFLDRRCSRLFLSFF